MLGEKLFEVAMLAVLEDEGLCLGVVGQELDDVEVSARSHAQQDADLVLEHVAGGGAYHPEEIFEIVQTKFILISG